MKKNKIVFYIIRNNFCFCVVIILLLSLFMLLSNLLLVFMNIANVKIVYNLYGTKELSVKIFNVESNDIALFNDCYVECYFDSTIRINNEDVKPIASYYNNSFKNITKTISNDGAIISKDLANEYNLNIGDIIYYEIGGNEKKVIISEILNDEYKETIFLPINYFIDSDCFFDVNVEFDYVNVAYIVKCINDNKWDYSDHYSIVKTNSIIRTLRLIIVGCIIVVDLLIFYAISKMCNILITSKKKSIGIYEALGYNEKDILCIYLLLFSAIFVISTIISLIMLIPSTNSIYHSINGAMKSKLDSTYPYVSLLINVSFSFFIMLFFAYLSVKKICKYKIIYMLRGDNND